MAYTPYDWQQTLRQKADYAEDRLQSGSPVVALSAEDAIVVVTTRRTQRKAYEIYDRLAFAGLGAPSDMEAIRSRAVDFAHAEGYQRSPEDVSIQRVVGFAISPLLKQAFADPVRTPLVTRGIFAQLGRSPEEDWFFVLNYDGEFSTLRGHAVVAGAATAERYMAEYLAQELDEEHAAPDRQTALAAALASWAVGQWALTSSEVETDTIRLPDSSVRDQALAEALEVETLEAAVLDRTTDRERTMQTLEPEELTPFLPS